MRPYYEHAGITIFCGDCREILPQLSSGPILTDPPYGNETNYLSFNDDKETLQKLISDIAPLILSAPRALITPGIANIDLYPKPEWILAWFTPAGAGSGPWGFCCWQPILAYGKDPYLTSGMGRRPDAIIATETSEVNGHPCPKPLGVWKQLLKRLSPGDEIIIDPFMGSGTTLRAAKDLGRRAIGIEICEEYCEISAKRLSQEVFNFAEPET
jgi:site-specific DNA-methyltransferase (adenine-specific)